METSQPIVSVIIRALNEAGPLEKLLKALKKQQYPNPEQVEVIVVDNESTDATQDIARAYGAKIITIPRDSFTYPKSMNVGASEATAPILVFTVGHAQIISNNWLQVAIDTLSNPNVAGIYSPCLPLPKHSIAEWFLYVPGYWLKKLRGAEEITKLQVGLFGATNVALKKSLWDKHHFNESYELGGEDGEWAKWALDSGYKIIRDTDFVVRHSHHLGWFGVYKQVMYWRKLRRPTKFTRETFAYRSDINWK